MPHNFAFDSFTVNGKKLNEVGINALIAGEMGVVGLAGERRRRADRGDAKPMLRNGFVAIVTKHAVGRSAAITYTPPEGAGDAAGRCHRGGAPGAEGRVQAVHAPEALPRRVQAPPHLRRQHRGPRWPRSRSSSSTRRGDRTFTLTTNSAREMGWLLDAVEEL